MRGRGYSSNMDSPRILVIHLRSTFTRLVSEGKHSTAARLVDSKDAFVTKFVAAHEAHERSQDRVEQVLEDRGIPTTWRSSFDDLNPDDFDLVVTVGGDGTVLHASHSIGATPVLGVNSSPGTSQGFFAAATADDFEEVLDWVLTGGAKPSVFARMKIEVEGKVVVTRALNDALFCHDCPASTTRYLLTYDGETEDQLSSGVWVSTAAGSTAAIHAAGGRVMRPGSKRLQFAVREPFPAGGAVEKVLPQLTKGFVSENDTLEIRSKTEAARLYIDGPHVVFPVEFGDQVVFSRSEEPLRLYRYNRK